MQLEELDVADGLLEHGDQVDLGAVGHQLLQRPQPLVDPLPPILQQEQNDGSDHRSSRPGNEMKRGERKLRFR